MSITQINVQEVPNINFISVNNRVCRICEVEFRWVNDKYGAMPDNHACEDCLFWHEKWQMRDDPTVARVNGNHYIVGKNIYGSYPKGMGGAQVTIKFKDGRVVTTDNLWHQGHIPEIWQSFGLTDNAISGELG